MRADLHAEPEPVDGGLRFLQTAGGRTGVPAPRTVRRPPFVQYHAPIVWTTLELTYDLQAGRYLALGLDPGRATLFRQTFFAEFELAIHKRAELGEALTGESLSGLYLELLREYQGHVTGACVVPDLFAIEWACVPHFYYDFYVYQYATGIVAANSLARDVLNGVAGAQDRYTRFLASGGSDYPLELLRRAGVDLESPAPGSPHHPDADEDIHPQAFTIAEARAMVARGDIVDLKSAYGLTLI